MLLEELRAATRSHDYSVEKLEAIEAVLRLIVTRNREKAAGGLSAVGEDGRPIEVEVVEEGWREHLIRG